MDCRGRDLRANTPRLLMLPLGWTKHAIAHLEGIVQHVSLCAVLAGSFADILAA